MSQNVDLSRRFWDLFNEREWDAWWSLLGENVEWHARTDKPDVDIYHGHSELERFKDAWMEMFPDIRVELTGESIALRDHVITPSDVVGTARTTGIEMSDPYTWLFEIAAGKIVHVREFHDTEEALAAASEASSGASR